MRVAFEQSESLARELQSAGLEHGGAADVELTGVAVVMPYGGEDVRLAFCPANARVRRQFRTHTETGWDPFPCSVTLDRGSKRTLRQALKGKYGFARLLSRVHTNGSIHLRNVRVESFEDILENVPIAYPGAYEKLCSSGA